MIYIVSGDGPRCGSTMMMEALIAGGMVAIQNTSMDHRELSAFDMYEEGFPSREIYDGTVIKLFPDPWMPLSKIRLGKFFTDEYEGEYRIVWLKRDFEERMESYKRQNPSEGFVNSGLYRRRMEIRDITGAMIMEEMRARPDVRLMEGAYGEVLENPIAVFKKIEDEGWPINPRKAAKIVNPGKRNHGWKYSGGNDGQV